METTTSTSVALSPATSLATASASQEKTSLKDRIKEVPINWYAVLMGLMGAIAVTAFGLFFYLPLKQAADKCATDKSELEGQVADLEEECSCPDCEECGDDGDGTAGGETCDCSECDDTDGDGGTEPDVCSVDLTAEEQAIVADWNTFTFGSSGMSFKYPNDFNIEYVSETMIQIETTGFGFIGGRFDGGLIIEPADREITTDVTLWCADARRTAQEWDADAPGDFSDLREIKTLITFDDSTYYFMAVSYHYEGASVSADIVEMYDILLKTVRFE